MLNDINHNNNNNKCKCKCKPCQPTDLNPKLTQKNENRKQTHKTKTKTAL